MDVDAKHPGGGGRFNADTCGQGGEGESKICKILGRLLWMAPNKFQKDFFHITENAQNDTTEHLLITVYTV